MTSFLSDLRLGYRTLVKSPGFTLAAVLTLALGIGGNLAIFSIANALLFRPVPLVQAPNRLAWILGAARDTGRVHGVSYPDARGFDGLRDVFSGVLAQTRVEINFAAGTLAPDRSPRDFGAAPRPVRVSALLVSGNYFSVLGVQPALGRGFLPEEDRTPGTHPVVVISDALWRREFAGARQAVGRSVTINAHPFTIVGVLPARFAGADLGERPADVYVPVMMAGQAAVGFDKVTEERELWAFSLVGRLQPGVSMDRAAAAVRTAGERRNAQGAGERPETTIFRLQPMAGSIHPGERSEGLALGAIGLGVAGVVLLIACANIAALQLSRATGRRREMAVRLALGAGRRRLVRQLLTESLLLSVPGAAAGLLLAAWTTGPMLAALGVPFAIDVSPDGRVAGAALALALAAALLFGTAPAFAASRTEITPALSDGAAASGMTPGRRRLQRAFVVAQIALSLMLLASGALLLRSMQAATEASAGVETSDRILTASFDLAAQGYTPERRRQMSDLLLERVGALPGVQSATIAGLVPLGGVMWGSQAQVEDTASASPRQVGLVFMNPIRPAFFRTVGLRLTAGRDFAQTDDQSAPRVGIVSETMARSAWPNSQPVGRRFRLGGDGDAWITVVGVVADAVDGPGEPAQPFVYLPMLQGNGWRSSEALLVRAAQPAGSLANAISAEVHRLDPTLPVFGVATMQDVARERLLPRRAGTAIVAGFGLLALGLAAIGLYGVVSYMVAQRRREIGIRMALGADRAKVVRTVLREGLQVALVGLAVGLALAVGSTSLLASMFQTVRPYDAASWLLPALVVMATVFAASALPALRASQVDPVATLRSE